MGRSLARTVIILASLFHTDERASHRGTRGFCLLSGYGHQFVGAQARYAGIAPVMCPAPLLCPPPQG